MRIRKSLVAIGIVTGSALASTLAFAAWNADGKGSASVAAKTAEKLVVTNVATGANLYPGGSSSLSVKVNNPNPYPVKVTDIVNDGASSVSVDSGHAGNCTASNVSFANQTGLNVAIASGADATITVPGVAMVGTAQDGCQGAIFTFAVQAIGLSDAS